MKRYIVPFIVCGMVALLVAERGAGETGKSVTVPSRIDRVMVYHDRALVTRRGEAQLKEPGVYDLVFRDLPSLIQDDSVRATADGKAPVKILDVEVRSYDLEHSPDEKTRQLRERLRTLLDESRSISDRLQVIQIEKDYLNEVKNSFLYGRQGGAEKDTAVRPYRLSIKEYEEMLDYLNRKHLENRANGFRLQAKSIEVGKKIAVVKGELEKLQGSESALYKKKLVKVTVETVRSVSLGMEISYINYRVNWNPGYDIRVLTAENATEFTGYGVVSHSSGEDWVNARVSYSTAQPARRGWIPDLVPLYATVSSKVVRGAVGKIMREKNISQQAMNRSILDNVLAESSEKPSDGEQALGEDGSMETQDKRLGSLVFDVPKRARIPGDGSPHRTAISRHRFPVKFEYLSIPKLSPYAYLQALGKNTLDTPILQGDLNIYMGSDFVGSSFTGNILPGEEFELMLGINENIRVRRTLEERHEKKGGFLSAGRKISYGFSIRVENYSGREIVMNLVDQIPVSETSEVEVRDVSFSDTPQKRLKNGIVKWQFPMKSGASKTIAFSFTVVAPENSEVAFFTTKLPPSQYLQNKDAQRRDEYEYQQQERIQKKAPALRQKMY
ncbi:MAG TPA: mucoidy inhibitor MuiA family protein [Spirochaetes bacterium]|nr:mucoidy inhibitor MuiA family protein [Spirochaetota bacterium]